MMQRKRLEGALADWHPHPKSESATGSLAPMVRDPIPTPDPNPTPTPPDEITERFFAETPEVGTPGLPAVVETGERRVIAEPAAILARRRYLMRYVAGAVSLAALIGIGAIVRVTSARGAIRASAASLPLEPASPPPMEEPPMIATAAVAEATPPAADSAEEPAADTLEPDPKGALEAKRLALRELEFGHLAASVDAGERSVALDPTDADAWRILGAAYQKRGAYVDARRCFTSCTHLATRGDRFECSALLQ